MSVGIIQIGQCGNQIGCNIFNDLIYTMKNSSDYLTQLIYDTYFSLSDSYSDKKSGLKANALLIDMEAKVINKVLKQAIKMGFEYAPENAIHKQSGSGNNWANGFFHHGPTVEDSFVETVAKFSENFDYLDTCVMINSLAGGTGSGLGSYLAVLLKDYFPEINLINIAIWPNDSGEVVVNSYNTLFSISENYKVSDMMTLINNQEIFDICKNIYNLKKISFEDLNEIISHHIINMLVPAKYDNNNISNKSINNSFITSKNPPNSSSLFLPPFTSFSFPSSLLYFLCSDPHFKFTHIISTPEVPKENLKFSNFSWNSLSKRGLQMVKTGTSEAKIDWNIFKNDDENNEFAKKTRKIVEIFRGKKADEIVAEGNINSGLKNFKGNREINNPNDVSILKDYCNENNIKVMTFKDNNILNDYEKHLTLLSNSNLYCNKIRSCLNKAYEMFEYNAFVHQYQKYGLEKGDFMDAFAFCEQIIYDYNKT